MPVSSRIKLFKGKVRRVAVVYRRGTPQALALAGDVAAWLKERKIQVFSHPSQKIAGARKLSGRPDLVVVLGGDGTYLEAVRMLEGERVPLLGFNMGGLGFLTVHRAQDVFEMLQLALNGRLEVKSRSTLRVSVRNGTKLKEFTAVNDLVIERGSSSHLVYFSLTVDRLPITAIKADTLWIP